MYFPYLRGRQFELIALRELLEKKLLSDKIIPVIEPVKISSTLIKTIQTYEKEKRKIAIIVNPKVGGFTYDINEEKNAKLRDSYYALLENNENIIFLNILSHKEDQNNFIEQYNGKMGLVFNDKDAVSLYEEYYTAKEVLYNFMPDESGFRRKITEKRVILDDRFNKQNRNNDYSEIEDEPFSDDHLYYEEEGYVGFADYSIVGEEYRDTGFAPYAVAIHMVYFDDNNSLRIKHFVSDSNDDISDPAGKFKEALKKLVQWSQEQRKKTSAMLEFEDLFEREVYPGLGTVKKISIMHHLELMGTFLDKE